jgi:hypothetical protein
MSRDPKSDELVRAITDDTMALIADLKNEVAAGAVLAETLEADKRRLLAELESLRRDASSHEAALLRRREELEQRCASISDQNASLANLYVSSYRLHQTLDRAEVLTIIEEIVINLVGSEELAIFELKDRGRLELVKSFGLDEAALRRAERAPLVRRAIDRKEVLVPGSALEREPDDAHVTVVIPLVLGEAVTGVITIHRLLAHKGSLSRFDRELFELLATHAATALYCTELHAQRQRAALR